jgi:hypothetical protein
MGATTYRLMSGFAEQTPDEAGMAGLTAQPKVVFSSTLEGPLSWANTELVGGDAVDAVRAMKQEARLPMRTLGSLEPAGMTVRYFGGDGSSACDGSSGRGAAVMARFRHAEPAVTGTGRSWHCPSWTPARTPRWRG